MPPRKYLTGDDKACVDGLKEFTFMVIEDNKELMDYQKLFRKRYLLTHTNIAIAVSWFIMGITAVITTSVVFL